MARSSPLNQAVSDYIAKFPPNVRRALSQVRKTIRSNAPEAEEVISYQMPAYRLHGMLIYFAGWKEHVGLYPPVTGDMELERAVSRYANEKGNLQLPLSEPMPLDLIERIVKQKVAQNIARAEAKKKVKKAKREPSKNKTSSRRA